MKKYVSLMRLVKAVNQIQSSIKYQMHGIFSIFDNFVEGIEENSPFTVTDGDQCVECRVEGDAYKVNSWQKREEVFENLGGISMEEDNSFEFPYVMELCIIKENFPWLTDVEFGIIKTLAYISAAQAYRYLYYILYSGDADIDEENLPLPVVETPANNPIEALQELGLVCEWDDENLLANIEEYLLDEYIYSPRKTLFPMSKSSENKILNMAFYSVPSKCSVFDILNSYRIYDSINRYRKSCLKLRVFEVPLFLAYAYIETKSLFYQTLTQTEFQKVADIAEDLFKRPFTDTDIDISVTASTYGWLGNTHSYHENHETQTMLERQDEQLWTKCVHYVLRDLYRKARSNVSDITVNNLGNVKHGRVNVILDNITLSWERENNESNS